MNLSSLPFRNSDLPTPERVKNLLEQLTLDEKMQWMTHDWVGIDRLEIPPYCWLNECLHGVARAGTATVFPQAIGMAASWNPELLEQVASAISDEARAKHHEAIRMGDRGMYKGLTFYSPNINIFRDPRWGRGHETYGEDPRLTGRMGTAFIQGLQGQDPNHLKTGATAKHYAVHSGPESQRMTFDVHPTPRDLRETYLPAFRDAVVDGGVVSVMPAYNRIYGAPGCASRFLLEDVLRNEWGFEGFVISDGGAFDFIHDHHMVTRGPEETVALAFGNGCDQELGDVCKKGLASALEHGSLSEMDLDRALTRCLTILFRLGWFDPDSENPYAATPYEIVGCEDHRALNREMARQSIVLLKNENQTLPLRTDLANLAVCGPNADSREVLIGNYNGLPAHTITALQGIQQSVGPDTRVWYAQGSDLTDKPGFFAFGPKERNLSEAVAAAKRSDAVILCMGLDPTMEGENGDPEADAADLGGDRRRLELPACQEDLIRAVHATNTPIVLILFGGSPCACPWAYEHADAVIQAFYPGEEGGRSLAEILFGKASPSGRLPITIPHSTEQIPPLADYRMQGRTYRYMDEEPSFWFGHGLSYTCFTYDQPTANLETVATDESLTVSCEVVNAGDRDGEEVVQLYLRHEADTTGPHLRLEDFQRISLKPGERRTVSFTLSGTAFQHFDEKGHSIPAIGKLTWWIAGGNPRQPATPHVKATVQIQLEK